MDRNSPFGALVALACHDLRTPLATVHGFARTLIGRVELAEPAAQYVVMIDSASTQIGGLLDRLALAARIESGRYEPELHEADLLDLAHAAAAALGEETVAVAGAGGRVVIDLDPVERAVCDLARCAVRHGGLDRIGLNASDGEITIAPVEGDVEPILLGEDLRDLGAAVAVMLVDALGGSVRVAAQRLTIRLPEAAA